MIEKINYQLVLGKKFVPICTITHKQLLWSATRLYEILPCHSNENIFGIVFFHEQIKVCSEKKFFLNSIFFCHGIFFNFSLHSKNELQKLFSCYVYCYPFLAQLSWKLKCAFMHNHFLFVYPDDMMKLISWK